jgi:hypothetical protein
MNYIKNNSSTKYFFVLLIASLNCLSILPMAFAQTGSSNSTDSLVSVEKEQRLPGASPPTTIDSTPQPRPLTDAQREKLVEELQGTDTVPDIPRSSEPVLGPDTGTEVVVNNTAETNTTIAGANSTNISFENIQQIPISNEMTNTSRPTLAVIENKTFTPGGGSLSYTMESSLANKADLIFYTGNWFAARSIDGGSTWGYISPYQSFQDFCCDQDVVYDPEHDIFIWYRQGLTEPENDLSIGVSKDTFTWRFYTFSASDIDSTFQGQFSDYPSLALSSTNLYISMNMFENGLFSNPLMLRISLNDLADPSGIGPSFEYYVDKTLPRTSHTFTPVQGANDTMYWGIHLSTSLMRLYEWSDTTPSNSVKIFDQDVPAWTLLVRGEGHCPGPNGQGDWCIRGQSKIRGAFMANDIIGFFWDANAGGRSSNNAEFKYPYVDAATFDTNANMTYTGRPYLWSPTFAWMYGYGSPDNQGNVAIQAFFGGGQYYPSIAAGVGNDFRGQSSPWEMIQLAKGTHGPTYTSSSPPSWGDYIRIRAFNGDESGWIGSGWILSGGNTPSNIIPYYFELILEGGRSNSTTPSTELVSTLNQDPRQQNNYFLANFPTPKK